MPTLKQRRATKAQWTAANPVLAAGEQGFEINTNRTKIGDGLTPWSGLTYFVDEASVVDLFRSTNQPITTDTSVGTRVFVGNTMIYGDTEWRNVPRLTANEGLYKFPDPPTSNNYLRWRRTNDRVFVAARVTIATEMVGLSRTGRWPLIKRFVELSGAPSPIYGLYGHCVRVGSAATGILYSVDGRQSSGRLDLEAGEAGSWLSYDELLFQANWFTTEAWPTTLAGTPA